MAFDQGKIVLEAQRKKTVLRSICSAAVFAIGGVEHAAHAAPPPGPTVDHCVVQAPDAILWVPLVFDTSTIVASGSGEYAYGQRACPYFIAEIKMATYSHSYKNEGVWKATPLDYAAGPYDLPSSAVFGGTLPVVQEDCKRLTGTTRLYTKKQNEATFTWRATAVRTGSWSSGHCALVVKSSSGAFPIQMDPSQTGWDTYRIVTKAKLRSTYQEVAVFFAEPPPR